jgi:hypothetical protein
LAIPALRLLYPLFMANLAFVAAVVGFGVLIAAFLSG